VRRALARRQRLVREFARPQLTLLLRGVVTEKEGGVFIASAADQIERKIEARQDNDGSTFLAVPMPSREAVARFTDGLAALLRSMLP
jgi:alkanesulfonate monooxygenase SsuD/methylene tetrahydromethanopterin reductase-like flavin-dependent oxidoreductase (luciferase family)